MKLVTLSRLTSATFTFFVLVCTYAVQAKSNQFVAKKTKKVSVSSMQKECCQQFGDVLTKLPELIKRVADVQQQVMSQVGSYMQGEKTGLWSADKKTVETSLETVQLFEKQLHVMEKQLNDFLLFLQK